MGTEPRLGSKIFYKIGEVSRMTKLPAYVLRFWESEFSFLKPKKSRGNQRLYVQRDVETVFHEFGHLLHQVLSRVPVRGLNALANAMPFLRGRFATHKAFSEASVAEILGAAAAQAQEDEAIFLVAHPAFRDLDYRQTVLLAAPAPNGGHVGVVTGVDPARSVTVIAEDVNGHSTSVSLMLMKI